MEALSLLFFIVVGGAGISILWSIGRGLILLRKTYVGYNPNKSARRLLAWNLIEPGLTVPNVLLLIALESDYAAYAMGFGREALINRPDPMTLIEYLLALGICFWPMILLFVIVPLMARGSADPNVRWAAGKTAKLGVIRMIITIITYSTVGIGMLVGVPYLFWSLKKIRLWHEELLGSASAKQVAAIVGGKEGMLVLPANQQAQSHTFKVLMSED